MRKYKKYPKEVKDQALQLRRQGFAYLEILNKLSCYNIPKNTLSNWCTKAKIHLDAIAQVKLLAWQKTNKYEFQLKGAAWHKNQKILRKEQAKKSVENFLKNTKVLGERRADLLFFAGFYLGEGMKCRDDSVMFANSNVEVVKGSLEIFRKIFHVKEEKFRIALHLRADQSIEEHEQYWSHELGIPRTKFNKTQLDKRTIGIKSHDEYKGVCAIHYFDAKIQLFLLELQKQYVLNNVKRAVSEGGYRATLTS